MTKAVIFDIDGTLADCSHRLHHVTGDKRDWNKFFAEMSEDPPPGRQRCRGARPRHRGPVAHAPRLLSPIGRRFAAPRAGVVAACSVHPRSLPVPGGSLPAGDT